MNTFPRLLIFAVGLMLIAGSARAETAAELAAKLASVQSGSSFVRLRLIVQDSSGNEISSLQVQIKERRTESSAEVLYQILFPKERQGESVLLKQVAGGAASGHRFLLPQQLSALAASDMSQALFNSDLSYQDVIENFFAWQNQTLAAAETVLGVECVVLVSKPAAGQRSAYGSVKSWIDPARLVPLRVEKYDGAGNLVREINTVKVHKNDNGQNIPATLKVHRAGSDTITELEGARHRANIRYDESTFTVPKIADLTLPRKTESE